MEINLLQAMLGFLSLYLTGLLFSLRNHKNLTITKICTKLTATVPQTQLLHADNQVVYYNYLSAQFDLFAPNA